jgi:hypothetical protein
VSLVTRPYAGYVVAMILAFGSTDRGRAFCSLAPQVFSALEVTP